MQERHWLLQHITTQSLVRYSRETPARSDHASLIPPAMRPGGADAAAGSVLQEALRCHLERRVVPVQQSIVCRPPAATAAVAQAVAGASSKSVRQLLQAGEGDGLLRAVEEAARALRAVTAAAAAAQGEHSDVARKRMRAVVDDMWAVWGGREG